MLIEKWNRTAVLTMHLCISQRNYCKIGKIYKKHLCFFNSIKLETIIILLEWPLASTNITGIVAFPTGWLLCVGNPVEKSNPGDIVWFLFSESLYLLTEFITIFICWQNLAVNNNNAGFNGKVFQALAVISYLWSYAHDNAVVQGFYKHLVPRN